jgi:hypothetical protein
MHTGVQVLKATLSGHSMSEYTVVYAYRNNYTVLAVNVPPPIPSLATVQFSDDGISLVATFDSNTDQGNEEHTFICICICICLYMHVCIYVYNT